MASNHSNGTNKLIDITINDHEATSLRGLPLTISNEELQQLLSTGNIVSDQEGQCFMVMPNTPETLAVISSLTSTKPQTTLTLSNGTHPPTVSASRSPKYTTPSTRQVQMIERKPQTAKPPSTIYVSLPGSEQSSNFIEIISTPSEFASTSIGPPCGVKTYQAPTFPHRAKSLIKESPPVAREVIKRRVSHNEVERKRRDQINTWITKLQTLLPPGTPCGRDSHASKGQILKRVYDYVRDLESSRNRLEENTPDLVKLQEENAELLETVSRLTQDKAFLENQLHQLQQPGSSTALSTSDFTPNSKLDSNGFS